MRAAAAALLAISVATAIAAAQPATRKSGIDPDALDTAVRPQDDLFRYVNGRWLASVEMPADRVSYGTFVEIEEQTAIELRALIEELAARPNRRSGSEAQQIVDLYTSLMDEALAERLGATPLAAELRKIDAARTMRELAAEAGHLSAIAAGGPFVASVVRDAGDPPQAIVELLPGGTLLPERGDYLKDDTASRERRAGYAAYLTTIFTLVGRDDPRGAAQAVLALETELARAQRSPGGETPPEAPARYSLLQLQRAMPGFDWLAWAKPQGVDRVPAILLAQPSFFERFAALASATPLETWKAWLSARYVTSCAPFLSSAFSDARFEFFGRVLSGQELPRTRWKRAVSLVNGYLGDALGKLYVERRFPVRAQARARELVDNVVSAYRRALQASDWMSGEARREALAKLARLKLRVGRPDEWRSSRGLVVKPDDLIGNIERAKAFENELRMARLAEPAAHEYWPIPPQTPNAAYHAAANEIVLPAAILQPPLFDADADDAVNYGGIGAVIAHEIGHAFAQQQVLQRAAEVSRQVEAVPLKGGLRVNGARSLPETAGDLGGLQVALAAYRHSLGGRAAPVLDGLTGEQRFFIGWARVWRGTIRNEYLRQWLLQAPHPPPELRVNGPVSNLAAFHEAFAVKPGDRLYREPQRRVTIW